LESIDERAGGPEEPKDASYKSKFFFASIPVFAKNNPGIFLYSFSSNGCKISHYIASIPCENLISEKRWMPSCFNVGVNSEIEDDI
jgi:hypothetical protein